MPILTCPTCGSKLEVAVDDIGHVVQCGSCQQTFTADDPAEKKNDGASRKPHSFKDRPDDDDRPSRRRHREDDEDDDRDSRYRRRRSRDDDDYERQYGATPQTGLGITSMILGIVSLPLTLCYGIGILPAIMGIIFGFLSLKTAGRGMGIAGIITSVLSFLLLGAMVLYVIVVVMAASGGPGGGPAGGGGGGGRF